MTESALSDTNLLVEAVNVRKNYGDVEVLRGVNLGVSKGEVVVIMGPSGSGKSTFLRCVIRLEEIQGGKISVLGKDVNDKSTDIASLRSKCGMVFQQFNLFPHRTALENVMEGLTTVRGMGRKAARERAAFELANVGLSAVAEQRPGQLSGGQAQRVAIARALVMDPAVLLFDEPTSALDPELVSDVLQVMKQLADGGMTMIVVSHEMGFARRAADRVYMFDEGVVVEAGPPDEMFTNPSHERTKGFLNQLSWHDDAGPQSNDSRA